ncbi:MAG UNVERIFIED_CONTAM: hypothetical protein LVR18_02900 [Planctomycetaceae bacterium]|jgi:hypothetical protein
MSRPSSGTPKAQHSTADDIGVRFSGGSLVGYIAPDSTYAFDASGTAAIVGVSDLTLTGTLSAQKNTTGANVSKSITVAGVTRTLTVAANASRVGGSVTLITPVASLSADFAVETTGTSPNPGNPVRRKQRLDLRRGHQRHSIDR